jgi:hypothetical protein
MMASAAEKLAESRAVRTVNEDNPGEILVYGKFITIYWSVEGRVRGVAFSWEDVKHLVVVR